MTESTEIPPPPRPAEYEGVERSTGTALVVVGAALVILGLVLLTNPFAAIWILGVLIGVSLIIGGVAEVASGRGAPGPRWPSLVIGGLVIAAGVAAAAWPDATVWVLAVVAGLGLAISGAVALIAAVVGGADGRGLRLVLGGVSLAVGLAVLAWPDATLVVLAVLIGLRTLVNGVVSIGIGINIREVRSMSDADTSTEVDPPDEPTPDVDALKAERDALAEEVEVLHRRKRRKGRVRGVLAVVGVVMSCVLLLAACLGVFARRSFLKTDNFSNRAGALIDDPGVQTALSAYLTDQLNQLIDPQTILQDTLPDRAQILAIPLSGAVEGFIGDQVTTFVASDTFAELWKTAVSTAHREVVHVLEGDTPLLEESNDRIVINLLPVINSVLAQIGEQSPDILGRSVDLPTITVDDVPDAAREAIGDALGVTLDDNFGTFTVYDDGALSAAQEAVGLADKLVWVLVVLAPLAILATLAISPRRRRTLLQLTIGIALSMVLLRRLVFLFQKDLLDYVRIERNVPAVQATSEAFLDPLTGAALWVGIGALVIAAIALVTGPYPWAVRLRGGVAAAGRTVGTSVVNGSQDPATIEWVRANVDRLRIGGAVVGLILLWWLDLSWLGLLLLALLVGGYELVVHRLAEQATDPEDGPETPPADAVA